MEFGDYHIGQVLENAPCIASMKDILKYIEIWQIITMLLKYIK